MKVLHQSLYQYLKQLPKRFTRITTKNQNLLNLQKKNKRSLIKLNFATFAAKNYMMFQSKCSKSVTIVTSLESIVVQPMILPVIFHNLQGHDSHLFITQLAKLTGQLTYIPSTEEKYISFSKKIKVDEYKSRKNGGTVSLNIEIRFIDSFKFVQTSVANLVSNLQPADFKNISIIKNNVSLLTQKGVYPYDYVSSIDKFSGTQLPPKSEFYSRLNYEDISDSDYQHELNVWNTFNRKTVGDYHDLYLNSDVLLIADVFESFRATCLKHYNLDPAHYFTSPGLAWDACLKETGQELQLLHGYDKLC